MNDGRILSAVIEAANAGRLESALSLTEQAGVDSPEISNARAVCLMRLGRHHEAADVLRPLVLEPSGVVCRARAAPHHRRNFATALLLLGQPASCRTLLLDSGDRSPKDQALLDAIGCWEQALPFATKIRWWFEGVTPRPAAVRLTFVPGEFSDVRSPNAPRSAVNSPQ